MNLTASDHDLTTFIKAAELMGRLHDLLKETGYGGHQLELYLVRMLFCLFAEDTGIFAKDAFLNYLRTRTKSDGSDVALHVSKIFETLNKPEQSRTTKLDEQLRVFPYVNGQLFGEKIDVPDFDEKMRDALIECAEFDWSKISPAIFGAMFQSVMNPQERRNLGARADAGTFSLSLTANCANWRSKSSKRCGATNSRAVHRSWIWSCSFASMFTSFMGSRSKSFHHSSRRLRFG